MDDRLMDVLAERAVLGALLIDPDAVGKVEDLVDAADFHDEGNGLVYAAALSLHHEGSPVDHVTMLDRLGEDLRRIGDKDTHGAAYLTHLVEATPTALNAPYYARIVRRLSTLRGMMSAAGEIAKLAHSANGDRIDDLFDQARRLLDARAPARDDDHLLLWLASFDAFLRQQIDRCAELDAQEEGKLSPRAEFPWPSLQRYATHARPGTLTGVIAGPGVGKTSLMECIAERWAELGLRIVFFHLELSRSSMLDRRAARHSGVPLRKLEDGYLDGRITAADGRLKTWPGGVHYVHCPGWSASQVARVARKLHDQGECDGVIVDYLQKMRWRLSGGLNSAQARGQDIEILKTCAEVLDIPFVLGAQVSRKGHEEQIKTATYVRDTGELEDKANLLITIDRPLLTKDTDVGKAGSRSPVADCRVDKNTFGPTGPFRLVFVGERFQFVEMTDVSEPLNF